MADLDLAEPVNLIVTALETNWSTIPVAVIGADTRGGFDPQPEIRPVEGDPGEPRRKRTNLGTMPGLTEILVYEVTETPNHKTLDKQFGDVEVRITIDIYNIDSKARLHACYNEVKRVIFKIRKAPGGNYSHIEIGQKTDLTDKSTGLFRRTWDILLVKVSDYFGHA